MYEHYPKYKDPYKKRNCYKITPLLKLLITPRLRTLDLEQIDEESSNDISDVLHLATIRSPVNNKDLRG
jgi:hypothetical protein